MNTKVYLKKALGCKIDFELELLYIKEYLRIRNFSELFNLSMANRRFTNCYQTKKKILQFTSTRTFVEKINN